MEVDDDPDDESGDAGASGYFGLRDPSLASLGTKGVHTDVMCEYLAHPDTG